MKIPEFWILRLATKILKNLGFLWSSEVWLKSIGHLILEKSSDQNPWRIPWSFKLWKEFWSKFLWNFTRIPWSSNSCRIQQSSELYWNIGRIQWSSNFLIGILEEFRGHLIFWSEYWSNQLQNSDQITGEFCKNSVVL